VTQHYRFAREIVATARRSQVPDVAWSPDGNLLAASYTDLDEVALLDARSGEVQRRYCNPQARFDAPHGVLLTERHLIVSNKLNPADRPAVVLLEYMAAKRFAAPKGWLGCRRDDYEDDPGGELRV